jgi:Amt family ammonium transporter
MIDFAGSGVVHMVGGFAGLMGAIIVGPRTGRFENGHVVEFTYGNKALQALGTFILWFGWYGFNCGSTLALSGGTANVAAKVAFNTTLAPALSCLVTVFLSRLVLRHYDLSLGLNGVLAGVFLVYVWVFVAVPPLAYACAHTGLVSVQLE